MDLYLFNTIINVIWYLFTIVFILYRYTSLFSYAINFLRFCNNLWSWSTFIYKKSVTYLYKRETHNNEGLCTENEKTMTFYQKTKNYMHSLYGKMYTKVIGKPYPHSKPDVYIPLYQTQHGSFFNNTNELRSSYKEFCKEKEIFDKHLDDLGNSESLYSTIDKQYFKKESVALNHETFNHERYTLNHETFNSVILESPFHNNIFSEELNMFNSNYVPEKYNLFENAPLLSENQDYNYVISDLFNDNTYKNEKVSNVYNIDNSSLLFNPTFIEQKINNRNEADIKESDKKNTELQCDNKNIELQYDNKNIELHISPHKKKKLINLSQSFYNKINDDDKNSLSYDEQINKNPYI